MFWVIFLCFTKFGGDSAKIRVSISVVTQANTTPGRLWYFLWKKKNIPWRGQAKNSGIFKFSLQFQASSCYCMADLHPDKCERKFVEKSVRKLSGNGTEINVNFWNHFALIGRPFIQRTVYENYKSKEFLTD